MLRKCDGGVGRWGKDGSKKEGRESVLAVEEVTQSYHLQEFAVVE